MSSREPYRFISYDSRDENLVQFYVRTVNNAPYIQFTYISPRDRRWADIIEANDIIFFTQDNLDVASATIAAPYDSENGFRLSEVPSPALNEGNYYGIDYSRDRPEEDRDVPVENRGWSPLYGIQYLNFDDPGYSVSNTPTMHFAFRLVDWTSGRGTKPQLGYLGVNGIVADVANAAIMTLPQGPRGESTKWTQGTAFPTSNRVNGDMHLFTVGVSGLTDYYEADGTTAKTSAVAGEAAQWDGTKWVFVMVIGTGGVAFSDTLELGNYDRANGAAIGGHYLRETDTRVDIAYINDANENKETEIRAIQVGWGLKFGDKIFVIEWTNEDAAYREFNGFWANDEPDTTAEEAQIGISVIRHELRMIRFMTAKQIENKLEIIGRLKDLTSDIHVQSEVGDFANVTDAAVAGISQAPVQVGQLPSAIDFGSLTYSNPSTLIPFNTPTYTIVRIAKSLGRIESQFRTYNDYAKSSNSMGVIQHQDENWYYYAAGVTRAGLKAGETIQLQRRTTHTHTRYDGELGEAALQQVDARIPEHDTSQALENRTANLEDRTSDLHVQQELPPFANLTDATIGGIAIGAENATSREALAAGTYDFSALTFANPSVAIASDASTDFHIFVRVRKTLGRVEPRFRVYEQSFGVGINFPLRQLISSDVDWNYYTTTEGGPGDRWFLQYRATHTHTRYDGELGTKALEQVDGRIPEHQSFEDLEDKTSDIHINDPPGDFANLTDSAIGGVAALLESPAVVSAIAAGTYDFTTLTWDNPSISYSPTRGQEYQVIVRVAKTTIETQFRVLLKHAIGDTQRYYGIGESIHSDTNWNYYSAVRGNLAATATLEYRETHTHTRYDGELGKAALEQVRNAGGAGITADQVARLLPALPAAGERNAKIAKFVGNVLTWLVDPAGEDISALADRLSTDETKLENFIQTVNNYFKGQGEGDVTADQIAYLFALLDEYNPVIDDIRSTLGLVSELGEPTRLIEAYEDQTTFLSNAAVPSTLPKIEYLTAYLDSGRQDAVLYAVGESPLDNETIGFNYTTLNNVVTGGSEGLNDPFLRYYLNGDTDEADGIHRCAFFIADNRVHILLQKHTGGGTDPLAAFTSASLRPYISYAPLDNLAVDGTITKQAVETLAPTNADHDIPFVPSFQALLPDRRIALQEEDARGWYVNNTDSGTTFNSILAKWYADFQWLSRMYEDFRRLVEVVERGVGSFDPRRQNWIDGSKNPLDPANSVVRPPYASLDALKAAFPIPDLTFYFKLSVDGMVMNLADHDIHRPKRNKLVQIPDTHYNTPPRVTFLPMIARENEVFQLVSDQYRPDSDHTWTFQPERRTVNNRTVAGASIPTTLGVVHQKIGETSDTIDLLPDIFQRNAVNAIVAFADDPEHLHLYINPLRATTTDVLTVEIHGFRSDRSPIVRTATFRYAETFSISADTIRRFQSRVSGAYGIMDLSETISISIKRGNTYLYLNDANSPATPEWETGLLHTAGLYKGKADGTFTKAVIIDETEYNRFLSSNLPTFPAEGSRDNKAAIFDGDNLTWEVLMSGGLTAGQLARLLPALPAPGSRNDKIPKFSGDTLVWEDDAAATSTADGKVIFGDTNRPANNVGKIGDTYLRRQSNGIGLYEKTAAEVWSYRYALLLLPSYPSAGSRNDKILRFADDVLGWEDLSTTGISAAQIARLLPTLPAEGSRDDKIPKFDGDTLGWETPVVSQAAWDELVARGIPYFRAADPQNSFGSDNQWWYNLAAGKLYQKRSGSWVLVTDLALESELQAVRQLPALPAEGSRNDKFPIFQNDTLMWENFPTITTIAGEWNTIAARTTIAIGTLVRHGGNYYGCIVTHTKSSNGPDGDPTNWQLLSAYQGVWAAGYYHAGSITVRGAGLYLALHNVGNTDPAPDASTNVKWLQINNVEPPARYIELTVNASIAISNDVNVAAVPLTYASALAKSNENTGFLSRNANGNQITLAAGSYELDTHIVINQGGRDSARSTYTVQIFNGATMIDEKTYLDYLRGEAAINLQSVSSSHIFTLSGNANIQVRIKKASTENSGRDFTTAAGGSVIVKRL